MRDVAISWSFRSCVTSGHHKDWRLLADRDGKGCRRLNSDRPIIQPPLLPLAAEQPMDAWLSPRPDRQRSAVRAASGASPILRLRGNGSHINQLKVHDGHQLTALPVGRRGRARGRLGIRPGGQPRDHARRRKPTAPGQNLSKKLNQSNPSERGGSSHQEAGAQKDSNVVPPPGTSGGAPAPQPK